MEIGLQPLVSHNYKCKIVKEKNIGRNPIVDCERNGEIEKNRKKQKRIERNRKEQKEWKRVEKNRIEKARKEQYRKLPI